MARNLKQYTFFFLIFWCLCPKLCQAEVYVWIDGNGIRHYSNISPPDRKNVNIAKEIITNIQPGDRFKVIRIFDGDTIEVKGAGLTFKVRLVGIDTPETGRKNSKGQPYAQKAKQVLMDRIIGKHVRLKQYGTGGYNRILAEIFSGGRNINLIMVQTGMAEIYRGSLPSSFDIAAYTTAQKTAKRNRTGIWSLGKRYKSPKQWRKENPWK